MYIPVDYPEKQCKWCKKLFKPNRSDKQFCRPTCRKKHGKKYLGHSAGKNSRHGPYKKHKKLFCSHCGFKPEHPCQLDVDHIDGNHNNNDINNLQTLCANCHRLKTAIQLGWL